MMQPSSKLTNLASTISPFVTIVSWVILLWPMLVMVVALAAQARGSYILKKNHIYIFIGIQLAWMVVIYLLKSQIPFLRFFNLNIL